MIPDPSELPEAVQYRDGFARYAQKKKLEVDFDEIEKNHHGDLGLGLKWGQTGFADKTLQKLTGSSPGKELKVGIIGAGCAGLFTAMTIEWLNEQVKGLNIDYDLLEANDENRLGGRLFTYNFPKWMGKNGPHDYYDVGAMRFPFIPIMARTFRLFQHVGIDKKLIPYYLRDELNVMPTYFNDVHHVGKAYPDNSPGATGQEVNRDPYKINEGLPPEKRIPAELMNAGPDEVISGALKKFKDALKKDLDQDIKDEKHQEGWKFLMLADNLSTRQYLRSDKNAQPISGLGLDFPTIEWLETFEYATGWYDQSLSETVLEAMDFDYPWADPKKQTQWYCLEGGTQQLAFAMANTIKKRPEFNKKVTAIRVDEDQTMHVTIQEKGNDERKRSDREYFAVFNSTTLGAMQRMDLSKAKLSYGTKQAIRTLGYGASCKVGIRFKNHWWMSKKYNIKRGGVSRTDLPLRVCVYPSYNLEDPDNEYAVLLCSYTWSQDAQRIGSLISPHSPANEEELKDLMLRNLARLHAPTPEEADELHSELLEEYIDHHAFDWYADPYMSGAFAYFGPSQFSQMWPEIITPNGWLYIIGEAASSHHAWVVGALESAVRAVYNFLYSLSKQTDARPEFAQAMEALKNADPEKVPFGPLPPETDEWLMQQQAVLGFAQHKVLVESEKQ